MNLNNFLSYLTESISIEELKSKVGDSVPQSVLDTLASLMKGNKYDNIAMAIIKTVQDPVSLAHDSDNVRNAANFISKRPKLVYAALKEAAKGSDNFNAQQELRIALYNGENPMKFWAEFRSNNKENKERKKTEKKVEIGLKGAKPIELKNAYLFIPHGFKYKIPDAFDVIDLVKQQEDLKKLSAEMAKKDTSGEVRDNKKATDNHWCVAASEGSNYYASNIYKGGHKAGIFIIIVLKNPDGSPNWNERYLYWHTGDKNWNGEKNVYDEKEFADKFDDHVNMRSYIPSNVLNFIDEKIVKKLRLPKTERERENMEKRVDDVVSSKEYENANYTKKGEKRVNRDSKIIKQYWRILRYLRSLYKNFETAQPSDEVKITDVILKALKAYYFDQRVRYKENDCEVTFYRYMNSNIRMVVEKKAHPYYYHNFSLSEDDIKEIVNGGGKIALENVLKKSRPKAFVELKKAEKFYKPAPLTKYLYDDEPNKKVKDLLNNNKLAITTLSGRTFTDNLNDDSIREFFIGPNFYMSLGAGENNLVFTKTPWHISNDIDEDDIIVRVDGWDSNLDQVKKFCKDHNVEKFFPGVERPENK